MCFATAHAKAHWITCLLGLLALVFSLAPAAAEPNYPPLGGMRVVDQANLIPAATKTALEAKLADLEAKTSAQVVIATVPDLQGYAIEEFSVGLLRFWALGEKTKNNGVLILLSKAERKLRIEVGYGLEGALTDATSKIIIANAMVPPLRSGDYAAAFTRAVDDIGQIISGEAKDQGWKGTLRPDVRPSDGGLEGAQWLLLLLLIVIILWVQANGRNRSSLRGGPGFPNIIVLPSSRGWGGEGGGFPGGGGFSGGGGSGGGGGASGEF